MSFSCFLFLLLMTYLVIRDEEAARKHKQEMDDYCKRKRKEHQHDTNR